MITDILCLATTIFFESRNQPDLGQYMVAEVVINRVENSRFPDTVCDVVNSPKAFSFTHDGHSDDMLDYPAYEDLKMAVNAFLIAQDYLDGYRLGITSTHYHADYVNPYWVKHFKFDKKVGNHLFYTCSGYC